MPGRLRIVFSSHGRLIALFVILAAAILANPCPGAAVTRASALADSARALLAAGKYADAALLARETVRRLEAEGRGDSLQTAEILDLLVDALRQGGKPSGDEPRRLAGRALSIKERILGPDAPEVATSLTALANMLSTDAEFLEAKPLYERALAIRIRAFGEESVEAARSLNNLGIVQNALGEYAQAAETHARALATRERLLGPDHRDVAGSLTNLAKVQLTLGDYASAERNYVRALGILRRALNDAHPEVGRAFAHLAFARHRLGDGASAREDYERALSIQEAALGPDHPLVAWTLNHYGVLLAELGEAKEGRARLERALAIRRKALGASHPDVAQTLYRLARVEADDGSPTIARRHVREALDVYGRSDAGPEQASAAAAWHLLGAIYHSQGQPTRAAACLDSAARIWTAQFGPDHIFLAQVWFDLGMLRLDAGRPSDALVLFERAQRIEEAALGADHPDLASTLRGRALAREALGEDGPALADAARAEAISRSHIRLAMRGLSEREALRANEVREQGLSVALGLASRARDPATAERVWDELVQSRALVLDEMVARIHAAAERGDSAGAKLRADYARAAERLARLLARVSDEEAPERYRAAVDAARDALDRADRALATRRAPAAAETNGVRHLLATLPAGAALVAYVRFDDPAPAGRTRGAPRPTYLAFVATADSPVAVIPLGAAARIDSLASRAVREAARPSPTSSAAADARRLSTYREAAAALRRAVWDPIARALGSPRPVFIVPDAATALVSFAALPGGGRRFLIEEGWGFHHLSCERDLAAAPAESATPEERLRLVALGGPDFDARAGAAGRSRPSSAANRAETRGAAPSGGEAPAPDAGDCAELRALRFPPLPGATREVRDLESLWSRIEATHRPRSSADTAIVLVGAAATEQAFKRLAAGANILHLATHGFFLEGACAPAGLSTRGIGGLSPGRPVRAPRPAMAVPLLLSGLAFAGANHRSAARPGEENGILTAEEVSALDLSQTRWAVLSACDTGRGLVRQGEGVLGLRRAFQVAGARSLILSLWAVDDESAREWMRRVYEARWREGTPTYEAVRDATLRVLANRRASGQSVHPFYWAGFIAVGDWR